MKATLIVAKKHPQINHISIPGFCTGVGRMQPEIAANQMFMAFCEIEKGEEMNFKEFGETQKYQYRINPKGMIFDY